jgi:hypothetical protein
MDIWYHLDWDYDFVYLQVKDCIDLENEWTTVESWTWDSWYVSGQYPDMDADGWYTVTVDLMDGFTPDTGEIEIRFLFTSDSGWNFRGFKVDNIAIPDIGFSEDFENGLGNWCIHDLCVGNYWTETVYPDESTEWCNYFSAGDMIDNYIIWTTEISDAYEAYLVFETIYDLPGDTTAEVQISNDGGENWYVLYRFTGDSGGWYVEDTHKDISAWAGSDLLIRFIVESDGSGDGFWCLRDIIIIGKNDDNAPMTTASMTGTMTDAGWYSSSVSVTITATDVGAGMGEIHYILDGVETVVPGESASFTVSGNGPHNIEYWGVDKVGNEETPHNVIPTFRIDMGSPPSVSINEPTPGLYLFGNKLLSLSKIFIIGGFNIEATATDDESGVYRVQFLLDGDVISEDTEAPFSAYCAVKHSGAGVIKVIAEDFAGNTAEDTLDITYYKFL